MKKLMILAVVAFVAVATQAASLKWGGRNIYVPVAADVKVDQTGIVASSGTKFAADALTVALYWVNSSGGHESIGSFATTADGVIGAQTLADSTSAALYSAMLDDQGASWKPEYYFTATYTTADGTYTYSGTATATIAIGELANKAITTTANFSTAGSWNYTAAPEPTSGLLMLLGMAGLALRRKRA